MTWIPPYSVVKLPDCQQNFESLRKVAFAVGDIETYAVLSQSGSGAAIAVGPASTSICGLTIPASSKERAGFVVMKMRADQTGASWQWVYNGLGINPAPVVVSGSPTTITGYASAVLGDLRYLHNAGVAASGHVSVHYVELAKDTQYTFMQFAITSGGGTIWSVTNENNIFAVLWPRLS